MENSCERKHSQLENRKLVSEKIFTDDKSFNLFVMRKLKDLLENVRKWPAKHENCECFLSCEFHVIRYSNYTCKCY